MIVSETTVMYETVSGIWRRAREENTDVFVFCCYGGDAAEDTVYNEGEYNIFSLLHPEDYDGFIMRNRSRPVRLLSPVTSAALRSSAVVEA